MFALVAAVWAVGAAETCAQTIRGHLLDAVSGAPIDLGLVILYSADGDSISHTLTGSGGYFSVTAPDPGVFELLGAGLGYSERVEDGFELGLGGEISVEFRLAPKPIQLDGILVQFDRPVLEHSLVRNGFVRRFQREVGGRFITPYELERASARRTEDLFLGMSGMRVRPIRDFENVERAFVGDMVLMESMGSACVPAVYLDGVPVAYRPAAMTTLSSIVPLHVVQAVEVYRSPAQVPIEYNATRRGREDLCGVLVFWTKR